MSISIGRYHEERELPQLTNFENLIRQNSSEYTRHMLNENKVMRLTEIIRKGSNNRKSPVRGF